MLTLNPHYVPALQVQAHAFIHTEQCTEALSLLHRALKVNANGTHTLAMISACQILGEKEMASKATLKKALQVNPRAASAYHTVADYMVVHHRYTKAVELEREALRLDPEYGPSYVGLGIGYSRLGDDKKANSYLQKAFEQERYIESATLLTGALAHVTSVSKESKSDGRSAVLRAHSRMGAVGLTIDEDSPMAPLLQAALYLRLGDQDKALELYQDNTELFKKHRNDLPPDLIEFVCKFSQGDRTFVFVSMIPTGKKYCLAFAIADYNQRHHQ